MPIDQSFALRALSTAPIIEQPSEHLVIPDFLGQADYVRLMAALPDVETMTRYDAPHQFRYFYMLDRAGVAALAPDIQPAWTDLADFFRSCALIETVHDRFAATIRQQTRHRQRLVEKVTDPSGVLETPRLMLTSDCQDFLLKPHTDSGPKVVTLLYYLAEDGQPEDWGTEFYEPIEPDFRSFPSHHWERESFRLVTRAPFRPNTLVAFVKTDASFHGVHAVGLHGKRRNMVVLNIELGGRDDFDTQVRVDPAYFSQTPEPTGETASSEYPNWAADASRPAQALSS